jgi:glyoxylase-like metal-dependent hydrolase (beta-lactamase superfamily II)
MQIKVVVTGPLEENCYIIFDEETNECIIIDPGDDGEEIEEEVKRFSPEAKVKYILLTHAHFDHVGALKYVKEKLGGEILMHKGDLPLLQRAHDLAMFFGLKIPEQPPPDRFIEDSEEIIFNKIKVKAIHVPGHSPGGMAYLFSYKNELHLFTGDILFAGSIGRTDLPGGNFELLISGIKTKLMILPPETKVYPGHGPETTIAREKLTNPFILFY